MGRCEPRVAAQPDARSRHAAPSLGRLAAGTAASPRLPALPPCRSRLPRAAAPDVHACSAATVAGASQGLGGRGRAAAADGEGGPRGGTTAPPGPDLQVGGFAQGCREQSTRVSIDREQRCQRGRVRAQPAARLCRCCAGGASAAAAAAAQDVPEQTRRSFASDPRLCLLTAFHLHPWLVQHPSWRRVIVFAAYQTCSLPAVN